MDLLLLAAVILGWWVILLSGMLHFVTAEKVGGIKPGPLRLRLHLHLRLMLCLAFTFVVSSKDGCKRVERVPGP
jgi:hypothetical protein